MCVFFVYNVEELEKYLHFQSSTHDRPNYISVDLFKQVYSKAIKYEPKRHKGKAFTPDTRSHIQGTGL